MRTSYLVKRLTAGILIAACLIPSAVIAPVSAASESVSVFISSENKAYTLTQQSNLTFGSLTTSTSPVIHVDSSVTYQPFLGIGGSLEESSVYNLMQMSSANREQVLQDLFNPTTGIGWNLARITLGSSDFTGRSWYSYDDMPNGQTDAALNQFSIQKDIDYGIVDIVKRAIQINPDLKIFGSPWSPPGWMKDSGSMTGGSLLPQYYNVAAEYYRKAIQAYAAQGIPLTAMTVQNEPGVNTINYPSNYMTWQQHRDFTKVLGSELDNYGLSTKTWILDHNFSLAMNYAKPILDDPSAFPHVDGIAFHDYEGEPTAMSDIHELYPNVPIYVTERMEWNASGMDRIIQYFHNWANSYNSWVTFLDSNGNPNNGPFETGLTYVTAPATNLNNYSYSKDFYLVGQFSKFIKPGAFRIDTTYGDPTQVTAVAFKNPNGSIVTVVANQTSSNQTFKLVHNGQQIEPTVPAKAVATYVWTPSQNSNMLVNPGFETGTSSGWQEWYPSSQSTAQQVNEDWPNAGSYKLNHYASSAYQQLTYQSVSVPNGKYRLSAWVRSGGGQNALQLYAQSGGVEKTAAIGSTAVGKWTKYTIDQIQVNSGTVQVGVWNDANSGNWATFDDFELIPDNNVTNSSFESGSAGWSEWHDT